MFFCSPPAATSNCWWKCKPRILAEPKDDTGTRLDCKAGRRRKGWEGKGLGGRGKKVAGKMSDLEGKEEGGREKRRVGRGKKVAGKIREWEGKKTVQGQ